jgi:hypothetical protein
MSLATANVWPEIRKCLDQGDRVTLWDGLDGGLRVTFVGPEAPCGHKVARFILGRKVDDR